MKTLATMATLLAAPALAADPSGIYQTERGDTGGFLFVTIAACGSDYCGTITKAFNADNEALPDYEHLGKPIIWDMSEDGENRWSGGQIWAPDRDKTYASHMELDNDRLRVEGCVAVVLCRGQTWLKLQ